MILCNINKSEIPTLSARKGCEVRDVQLNDLKTDGVNLVSYGLKEGDQFEFPDTIEDVKLKLRQVSVQRDTWEVLILGLKNGKPAWLSAANLHRWDYQTNPVHPVARELRYCNSLSERIEQCLGRTIIAEEDVTYNEAIFEDGIRTKKFRPRTISKLSFLDTISR